MKLCQKKLITIMVLAIILALLFSSVAIAAGIPRYIYYRNAANDLVRADYEQAEDNLFLPVSDPRLMNAIRSKLLEAFPADRAIYVEDSDGITVNYSEAAKAGYTYAEAYAMPLYREDQQIPDKELIINASGDPEEVPVTVPGVLTVESISALNLKQLEVKFNMPVKKVDAETVANYTVLDEGVTAKTVTHAALQSDGQTVLLTIEGTSVVGNAQLTNLSEAKITVSNNVIAVNNQAMTADYVAEQVAVSDLTVPSIAAVQQKAPNLLRVVFSEPIKDFGTGDLTVNSANFLINDGAMAISAISNINIPSRYVDITTAIAMTPGSYTLKVNPTLAQRDIEDFAGWKIPLASTFTFSYVADTEPPVAEVHEISQTAVTYKFSKVVANADNNNVRYRHSVNTAAYELRGDNANVSVVNPADGTGTEVTVNYNAAGIPLPTGTVTLYINYDNAAGTLIRDAYNNSFVAASYSAQVTQDTEPPTATVTVVAGSNTLIDIQYSKAVVGGTNAANYTLKKGAANVPFTGPVSMGGNKYQITSDSSMQGTHTLTINNVTDTAVVPNEMPETTYTFNVTDTIPPEITNEDNITVGTNFFTQAGDDKKVRIFFSEAMNASDLADKTNYFNVDDSNANPTTATPATDAKSVYLVFAVDVTGDLTVKSMRDASGNFMTGLGRTLTTAAASKVGLDTTANVKAPTGAISTTLDKVTIYLNRKVTGVTVSDFEVNPAGSWVAPASVSVDNSGVNSVVTLTLSVAIAQDRWDTAAPQVRSVSGPGTQGDTAGAKDDFGNPVNFGITNVADGVAPVLAATDPIVTGDIDVNGKIDFIEITFQENMHQGYVSAADFTVEGYIVTSAFVGTDANTPAPSKKIFVILEEGTLDTDATPKVSISSSVRDARGNLFAGVVNQTAKDGAAPVLFYTAITTGANPIVTLTASEPLAAGNAVAAVIAGAGNVLVANPTEGGTAWTVSMDGTTEFALNAITAGSTSVVIPITEAGTTASNSTISGGNLGTAALAEIEDLAGNTAAPGLIDTATAP